MKIQCIVFLRYVFYKIYTIIYFWTKNIFVASIEATKNI